MYKKSPTFGLAMAGKSDKVLKPNYTENKYRYNGGTELQNNEFSDGTGLEVYDANARMYDPQIGDPIPGLHLLERLNIMAIVT